MIAQHELQHLLNLPEKEKLLLAYLLLDSVVAKANGQATTAEAQSSVDTGETSDEPSPAAKWLLSMAGRYSSGPPDTGARADEIRAAEIKRPSGFTTKPPLPHEAL